MFPLGIKVRTFVFNNIMILFNFKIIIIIKTLENKTLKNNKVIIDHLKKKPICRKELTSPTHNILPLHIPFAGN